MQQNSLSYYFQLFIKNIKVIIISVLVFTSISLLVNFVLPQEYQLEKTYYVLENDITNNKQANDTHMLVRNFVAIGRNKTLINEAFADLSISNAEMKVHINSKLDTNFITISLSGRNKKNLLAFEPYFFNKVKTNFEKQTLTENIILPLSKDHGRIVSKSNKKMIVLFCGGGFYLGIMIILLREKEKKKYV